MRRGGALLAFGAFEKPGPVFRPTLSTADLQTIRDTLNAHGVNEWRAGMDNEIKNIRHLSVSTAVPHPLNTNIVTPRWIFHWKFKNGSLFKHKACLVVRGFAQVLVVDDDEAHLYASVMRLESFSSSCLNPRAIRPGSPSILMY